MFAARMSVMAAHAGDIGTQHGVDMGLIALAGFAEKSSTSRSTRICKSALGLSSSTITLSRRSSSHVESGAALLKPVMDDFFGAIRVLPYNHRAAQAAARTRAELKRRGRPIGAYDALIAGTALANELILISSNLREFKQVEGLPVEDWRSR
jgi:predicted nucleic acid-binding protein